MHKKMFMLAITLWTLPFSMIFSGCGFDNLPTAATASLAVESGLSADYDETSGSAVIKTVEGEIHVTVSDIPAAGDGCSYVAYAITDEGSTSLGSFSLEAEAHHDDAESTSEPESEHDEDEADHDEDEEETTHHSGEIEADASALGIHIHEVTSVEVYHECSSSNATKILTATFGSSSDSSAESSGSEGGHDH